MEDNNLFVPEYNGQYTKEEIAILNMEVTPEIEKILADALMEKAMKDAVSYVPQYGGVDVERQLMDNLDLFEDYIRITKERDEYQVKWEKLRYARSTWWSLFKEEMDAPWVEYDRFVLALDKRMRSVEPTEEQWSKAMSLKSLIYQRCMRKQQDRRSITYPIYEKAMAATKRCQEFWSSHDGRTLSIINKERSALWNAIQELDCTWEDYNQLVGGEINPYWTNGDTEEVDAMELMANTITEYLDMLEDASHSEDGAILAPESRGPGFWSYRNAAIATHKAKEKRLAEDMEEAYQASLVSFMEDYMGCSSPSSSVQNGVYC